MLQHVATAGQIVGPCACLLGPCLVAVEPLAVLTQSQSRPFVVDRLVGALVNDESVHTAGHFQVGCVFQVAGIEAVGTADVAINGHRLGCHDGLSVEMSHRCRFADVTFGHRFAGREGLLAWDDRPHSCHRDVGMALGRHAIDQVQASVLMGFEVGFHAALMGNARGCLVHTLADEFANGGSPIEKEFFAAFGTLYNQSRQHGHPGQQTVAAPLLELLSQARRPRFPACFVAVDEQIVQATLSHQSASGVAVEVQIVVQEVGERFAVDFRHFQTRCLGRGGVVFLASQRVAEAKDAPLSLGSIP